MLLTFLRFQLFDNPLHHLSARWSVIKSAKSVLRCYTKHSFWGFLGFRHYQGFRFFFLQLLNSISVMEMKDYKQIGPEVRPT